MTPADKLVETIVMAARAMHVQSPPFKLMIGESGRWVMITTQEELGGGMSWWVRWLSADNQPIRSWHAEGLFGLMNAATQLSLMIYPTTLDWFKLLKRED